MAIWELALVGLVVGLYGLFLVARAAANSSGKLKEALQFFLVTDASFILYNVLAALNGYFHVEPSHHFWWLVILVHAIPGVTWLLTTKVFYDISVQG